MLVKKNALLTAAITLALTACGSSYTPPTNSGKAVDGYLSGSTVTCVGTGATVKTGATGSFTFSPACESAITVTGGTNIDTGFAFTGTLKAPAGATVASPLTTLITGMSAENVAKLLTSLGLTGTDLSKTDPADGNHLELLKVTLAVQQIVQQLTNSLGGSSLSDADKADLYAKIAGSVATSLTTAGAPALINGDGVVSATLLNTIATSAATVPGATNPGVAALAALTEQITTQAQSFTQASSAADLTSKAVQLQNPAVTIDTTAGTNYLKINSDAILLNGSTVALSTFATSATVNNLTTVGIDLDVAGTPAVNTTSAIFLELAEVGGAGRKLQVMIDKVGIKLTGGQLAIEPAAGARVYVFGHTTNGTDYNLTLKDLTFKPVSVDADNKISLNFDKIVEKVLADPGNTTSTAADKFTNITGTFATKIIVSDLNLRLSTGTALDLMSSSVSGSGTSITGRGVAGKLVLTQ